MTFLAGCKSRWLATSVVFVSALSFYLIVKYHYAMIRSLFFVAAASSISHGLAQNSWAPWSSTISSSSSAAVSGTSASSVSSLILTASPTASANGATFTNPILEEHGADPWVVRHGDYYYMTYTTNDNVTILRSSVLTFVLLLGCSLLVTDNLQGLEQC